MYSSPNIDEIDLDLLSMCADCAKHPQLKAFINENLEHGLCGICLSEHTVNRTCRLDRKRDLANLIKALIRFYWDEVDYNHHVGGVFSVQQLLQVENPIVHHENHLFSSRSAEQSDDFFADLLGSEPYPDPASGISIYGGHTADGVRTLVGRISRADDARFSRLRKRLMTENYFDVEPELTSIVSHAGDRIVRTIPKNTKFFRARIGARQRQSMDGPGVGYSPYVDAELGAPPAPRATNGRLNRAGVSFLYLASNVETAAAEVRPHPGHVLSLGAFIAKRPLKVAAFDVGIKDFSSSEGDLDLFGFLFTTDTAMSLPALPEDQMRYSITQLVADAVRQAGFDGVTFRSSVATGQNLCVFRPESLAFISGSSMALQVAGLTYEMDDVAVVTPENEDDYLPFLP